MSNRGPNAYSGGGGGSGGGGSGYRPEVGLVYFSGGLMVSYRLWCLFSRRTLFFSTFQALGKASIRWRGDGNRSKKGQGSDCWTEYLKEEKLS